MATDNDDKKCCTHNEGDREGTSLLTRFLPQLDPAQVPVDPRTTQDILVFAKQYADLVRYYDLNDNIDWVDFENGTITGSCSEEEKKGSIATWKEFFARDIAVVVASIAAWKNKLYLVKKEYNDTRKTVENSTNNEKERFQELLKRILHHFDRINRWYGQSVQGHPLKEDLEIQIKSFLVPALKQLIAWDKGMLLNVIEYKPLINQYSEFKGSPWNVDYNTIDPDDSIYVGDNLKKKIVYGLLYIDDIFNTLYKVYEELTQRSGYYWEQAIKQFPAHQPHMALFISFVELFSFATKELNKLTKRHLDFFYRDVLNLQEKPARPDSVYLIYQLAKGVDAFDLKEGTELTAGKDALGKQLVYKTDKELVINKAKVKELKTVFLEFGNSVKNIYAAPVANSADGKGEKFKDPETAWSTFGYFEPREPGDKMTGEKARFGFAIASPQFLLSSGERTIIITIKFNEPLPGIKKKLIRLPNRLLKMQFSGAKEWIEPDYPDEQPLSTEAADIGIVYEHERKRILEFINSAKKAEDIAGVEHQDGPVFDNPARHTTDTPVREGYDIGLDVANGLLNKDFKSLTEVLAVDKLGEDKMADLIYSFSDQYIFWNAVKNELTIKASIHAKQDAIVSFNAEKLKENFPVTDPLCKLLFTGDPGLYEQFKNATIQNTTIAVRVSGLTDLAIQTDDGPADSSKTIPLLTGFPRLGSSFSVGSPEFINKKLNRLQLRAEWIGDLDFADRYKLYGEDRDNPSNYTCSVAVFYENEWHTSTDVINLFQRKGKTGKLKSNTLLVRLPEGGKNYLQLAEAIPVNNSQVVRFTLNNIDFGHEEYPFLVASQLANRLDDEGNPVDTKSDPIIVESNVKAPAKADEKVKKVYVPKAPLMPLAKLFTVNYSSSLTLDTSNSRFFHIYPFGEAEIFPKPVITAAGTAYGVNPDFDELVKADKRTSQLIVPTPLLLPQFKYGTEAEQLKKIKGFNKAVSDKYNDFKKKNYFYYNQYESHTDQQGNLYIGIENLAPPQNLSLLFKFADGTAYDNDSEPPKINWSYLVNNEWLAIPADHIVSDSTYGFQTTGIILFDFPADATNNNTILTTGLYWLCASIDEHANRVPKLVNVIAQANQATFSDQDNDPVHYDVPLPEKTIAKPLVKIPEVKLVEQPFESFDGKPREQGNQFYQRVSERLRHKGRAITPSDYEHLLLEEFPSVYKVKILSHTDPQCLCRHYTDATAKKTCCCAQSAPGHVLILPVSNLRNKNAIDPLKPRTGRRTLLKIEEFFKKRVSPFVHIHAKNPTFEEVKVSFQVKFHTGIDKGFYLKKLNEDIIRHLTPWAYDSNSEVLFGNTIYASKVINAIEDFPYVDYITCFRMIHVAEGCCYSDSLPDIGCEEMQVNLNELDKNSEEFRRLKERFANEVSASSSRSILVSAKQHCITLIEEGPEDDTCNCKPAATAAKKK